MLSATALPNTTVAIKTQRTHNERPANQEAPWLPRGTTLVPHTEPKPHIKSSPTLPYVTRLQPNATTPRACRHAPGPQQLLPSSASLRVPFRVALGAPCRGGAGTLGRDGVLGAGGGGGLRAVATGVLQRVPAALLVLQAQPSGQDHGQVAGGGGHLLSVLRVQGGTISTPVPLLGAPQKPTTSVFSPLAIPPWRQS